MNSTSAIGASGVARLKNYKRRSAALELAAFSEEYRALSVGCDGTDDDLSSCAERRRESGVDICSGMILGGVMRANGSCSVPATGGTFLEDDQLRVQIIRQRNHEKQENQGADERAPLAPRGMLALSPLVDPASAPQAQKGEGHGQPQNVEK